MIEKLTNLPDYESTIINQGKEQRLIALTGLLEVYIASEMTMEIYQKLYLSSLTSLQKKKSLAAKQQFYKNLDYSRGRKSVGILGGNDCFSIIAASGTGKTSAIERCIDIIENETEINGVKILKCLTVQTPYDCSIKGLLLEILRVVDLEIGTSYYERTRQSMTVDMLIGIVSTVCLNHICTLIIDEIQNVIRNKNGRNLVGMLTQLINMNILMSLMMLSMIFVMMTMSAAAGQRVAEVINEQSDLVNPANPVYEVKDGSIRFKDVVFSYKKDSSEPVLKDIDLEIGSGETIGIIGGTGSAKSSLVNLISRLYDVTGGSVMVGGVDVRDYDIETLRNNVSVVLQKNVLFSGTILDNLRWGNAEATEEECRHACKLACADEFIERFPDGYNTRIEQGGTNVSGGQKQRLCIARALLKKPKILILDDSTSAVDTATDAKIRKAFAQEIPGTTKLIIAQRVSSVESADRIIVMEGGRINGFGTHEELLANNDIYRDVYESQTKGSGDFDENGGDQ